MTQFKTERVPFDTETYKKEFQKGAVIGTTSTTLTFLVDKPLIYGIKKNSESNNHVYRGFRWSINQLIQGNYKALWNNSLYAQSFSDAWQHPVKGFVPAIVNSCSKNAVLFPVKHGIERFLSEGLSFTQETASKISGFGAPLLSCWFTTPLSVLKLRMMSDRSITGGNMTVGRFFNGFPATTTRDSLYTGSYFLSLKTLKRIFGDNIFSAGSAGLVGFVVSNPIGIVGSSQKISLDQLSIFGMSKKIFKLRGAKGFYPCSTLAALGMFLRGVALDQGAKLYGYLMKEIEGKTTPRAAEAPKTTEATEEKTRPRLSM